MKWKSLLIAMIICLNAFSQTVSNVDAWQEGDKIVIGYDLAGPSGEKCDIKVLCSIDGGETFFRIEKIIGNTTAEYPGENKK